MESRLTFHDICDGVAWQKRLRDQYDPRDIPPVPHLDLKEARVRPVTRKLAQQIVLKYEWLGTMAPITNHYYGIFFGPYCAGVSCVAIGAVGANPNAHMEFGVDRLELAYLARGACVHWAPSGCNSKLVSWTCRLLREQTRAKLVIAYADTDAGEVGTIYQACNWICIGKGSATRQWVAPNGRVYDQKLASNLARRSGHARAQYVTQLRAEGWTEQSTNPKHRYVQILDRSDKRLGALLEKRRVPYPKRAGSIATDAPGLQPGEGGGTPTSALHS